MGYQADTVKQAVALYNAFVDAGIAAERPYPKNNYFMVRVPREDMELADEIYAESE